jgi:FAD/FMN-containing dehydrogenases
VTDVVAAIDLARKTGERVAVRSGGHCFAGRSSTDGLLIDVAGLDGVRVADDGRAVIGAGAHLRHVYAALHARGRTLPAGCGATVGIGGLTLGGGIGLLGRRYGLTCDRLVGARVVLADGRVVQCDADREPDLFWALRGAGGGQFGVVTVLRFDTVPEPLTTRIDIDCDDPARSVAAWQDWAPDAPDELTLGLTVLSVPGRSPRAVAVGAATLGAAATRDLLRDFCSRAGVTRAPLLRGGVPYHRLKNDLDDPREIPGRTRARSEFFSRSMSETTIERLVGMLAEPAAHPRRLTLTAMGGAYNRVAADATAFAHRGERLLLEHVGDPDDPWVDRSWSSVHAEGSGRVYPNFPDPLLHDWARAYHGDNLDRLVAIKTAYDPDQFFDFPQGIRSTERQP